MPWGHFLAGFVPLCLYVVLRYRRLPSVDTVFLILVATQLPDLVDKPLAWVFGVFPSGRLVAHSVVFAVPTVVVVSAVAWWLSRADLGAIFTFGYLSHVYTDHLRLLSEPAGYPGLQNVFFPLVAPVSEEQMNFLYYFERVELTPGVLLAAVVVTAAGVYFAVDLSLSTLRFTREQLFEEEVSVTSSE